ncbi:four helix bundle protein [Sphingobacterium sp. ML3W]
MIYKRLHRFFQIRRNLISQINRAAVSIPSNIAEEAA